KTLVSVKFTSIFDVVSQTLTSRMIFVTALFFVGSLFAAHKIAGPLYRIQRVARAIRQGDLSVDVQSLRAGDEMRELASEMNAAVEKIRHLMERYRGLAGQLSRLVAELVVTETPTSSMAEDAKKVREELQLISSQLVSEIDRVKLRRETVTQTQVG
ncbi:MAG: methyl-accepting chemotaxis protein, partial [Candidatus Omnitrophica bacterium]|nr:methyl-accepting chemotaxis protein [Candidatus Omnitrophota bacterium]